MAAACCEPFQAAASAAWQAAHVATPTYRAGSLPDFAAKTAAAAPIPARSTAPATRRPSATARSTRPRRQLRVPLPETLEDGLIARVLSEIRRFERIVHEVVDHLVVRRRINVLQVLVAATHHADRALDRGI